MSGKEKRVFSINLVVPLCTEKPLDYFEEDFECKINYIKSPLFISSNPVKILEKLSEILFNNDSNLINEKKEFFKDRKNSIISYYKSSYTKVYINLLYEDTFIILDYNFICDYFDDNFDDNFESSLYDISHFYNHKISYNEYGSSEDNFYEIFLKSLNISKSEYISICNDIIIDHKNESGYNQYRQLFDNSKDEYKDIKKLEEKNYSDEIILDLIANSRKKHDRNYVMKKLISKLKKQIAAKNNMNNMNNIKAIN